MNKWQPARVILAHGLPVGPQYVTKEEIDPLTKKVVRVRPLAKSELGRVDIEDYKALGCNAQKFYEIHPKDCHPLCGDVCCEHEVLSD